MDGSTISRLNGENKKMRERAEAAELKLNDFKDIDPAKARDAFGKLKDIDQGKLIESGKLDQVRQEITAQFQAQLTEKDNALKTLQGAYDTSQVNNLFAGSDFIRDRVAVPRDMFEATFRNNFKVEDGKIVAYDKAGNRLMSKQRIGEYADTSEALELLVESHPQKDVILRASDSSGSGSGGNGGGRGQGRAMKRAEFEKLPGHQQAEFSAKVRAGEAQLVD
jgi:hypothetical protein